MGLTKGGMNMNDFQLAGRMAQIFDVLELFHTPMFLVLVGEEGNFTFGGLNRAHSARTGLSSDAIAGKAPHDILPPRIAETVTANYLRCITPAPGQACALCKPALACPECARPVAYEELLELPTGPIWWKTHLSPVEEDGQIIALIGHAYDITEEKERRENLATRLNRVRNSADDLMTLSRASASQLRGPLHQIISFSEMLRPEFKPPMGRKLHFLNGIRDAAQDAMNGLDHYEEDAGGMLTVTGMHANVDFGHLCRDAAALVDPARDLNITFPETTVHTDPEALRWVVTKTMERIASVVGSEIAVTITPDGMGPRVLKLGIAFDLIDAQSHELTFQDREMLIAGAQIRGIMTEVVDRSLEGGRRGVVFGYTLSGQVGGLEDATANPRRLRSGRATC